MPSPAVLQKLILALPLVSTPAAAWYCDAVERSANVAYVWSCDDIHRYDLGAGEWLAPIRLEGAGCPWGMRVEGGRIFLTHAAGLQEIAPDGTVIRSTPIRPGWDDEVAGGFLFTLPYSDTIRSQSLDDGAIVSERSVSNLDARGLTALAGNHLLVSSSDRLWSVAFDATGHLAEPVELDPERSRLRGSNGLKRYGDGSLAVDEHGQLWSADGFVDTLPAGFQHQAVEGGGVVTVRTFGLLTHYDPSGFPVARTHVSDYADVLVAGETAYAFECLDDAALVETLAIAELPRIERPPADAAAPYAPRQMEVFGDEIVSIGDEPRLRRYSLDGALRGSIPLSDGPSSLDVADDGTILLGYPDGRITQVAAAAEPEEAPLTVVPVYGASEPHAVGDLVVAEARNGFRYAFDRAGSVRGWQTGVSLGYAAAAVPGTRTIVGLGLTHGYTLVRFDVASDGRFGPVLSRSVDDPGHFVRGAPGEGLVLTSRGVFDLETLAPVDSWSVPMMDAAAFGPWLAALEDPGRVSRSPTYYREGAIGSAAPWRTYLPGTPFRLLPLDEAEAVLVRILDRRPRFDRIHPGQGDLDDDGTSDPQDAFPLDPTETADRDQDGVGDNADAFPGDGHEHADSDGDGLGDNGDPFPEEVGTAIAHLSGEARFVVPATQSEWRVYADFVRLQLGPDDRFGACGVIRETCLFGTYAQANRAGTRLALALDPPSLAALLLHLGATERDLLASDPVPPFLVDVGKRASLELRLRRGGPRVKLRLRIPHRSRSPELKKKFAVRYVLRARGELAPDAP